jgi:uncharacterized protein
MTDMPAKLQDLLARLAYLELYTIFMQPNDSFQTPETTEGATALAEHLEYLFALENRGCLLAAGPLDLEFSGGRFEGICIIRASSRQEAEDVAAAEPFGRRGWRTNTVRSLHINEGVLVPAIRDAVANA